MIKLVHFADLHLGVENYGRMDPATGLSTRLADFLSALDQVMDYAMHPGNEVDLVIFAGDAFKTRAPSPTYQREFARRIQRLSAAGLPAVLVVGNHDVPHASGRAHTLEIYDTLEIEHVHVARKPQVFRIETRSGLVQVVALPWIVRSLLLTREEHKGKSLPEINELILERVTNIIVGDDGLVGELDQDLPTVLAAHATVQGAVYGSERSVMLGQDVVLPPGLVRNPAWDYVALGHVHKHQVLYDDPPVVYAGSIERIDFGEEEDDKGFVVAKVERGRATWQFHRLDARRFVTIKVQATGDDPTAQVLDAIAQTDVADAVVRVSIHTTADREPLIRDDEIRRALQPAFHIAAIAREVKRDVRLRLGQVAVEGMTPREALLGYLQARQTPPERIEVLLRYAERIFKEE
ncbi:MAG: exonuclease SbcCD subunit D [Chloroflexota bacterium]|nr:exonuclease SbcCD subunit D [Chloroflexota bacterium]